MSTTRVLAGDLSASLSFFLAGELILAFQVGPPPFAPRPVASPPPPLGCDRMC